MPSQSEPNRIEPQQSRPRQSKPGQALVSKRIARKALPSWLRELVAWLDDKIRIPGTSIHIGLDPIIGFFLPAAGDVVTGVGSLSLVWMAIRERVPPSVMLRMLFNMAVDSIGGVLPVIGDVFDLLFKSNRRNLRLIEQHRERHIQSGTTPRWNLWDYVFFSVALCIVLASIALPLWLLSRLIDMLG